MLAYTPFVDPLPVWNYWMALIIPLTVGVSIAYKSIKCREMSQVPREAAQISLLILLAMAAAALVLWAIVWIMEVTV
ncbi:MAG: hypothetical protein RMJ35_09710 [Phycisphaerales bacterium]|nr:hypothetical protein [Phycisphaerales bacterium]